MAASPAQRLLAEGAALTLTNGREVRVRFDMRALVKVEERFGSTGAMALELNSNLGKRFTTFVGALACGLHHEEGLDEDALIDLLDPREIEEYDQTLSAAWDEAFPAKEEDSPNLDGEQSSPGTSTTTSQQSGSDAQTESSGG